MPRKKAEERKTKERGNGQGTVWQEGDVYRWQVTLGYKADGKRIARSGRAATKGAAHAAMQKVQVDFARGLIGAPEKVTVREYAERWKRRQLEVTPRTAKRYGEELDYALKHLGDLRIQEVRPHHLKDLMVTLNREPLERTKRPMSPRTQAHVLTRLRSVFRAAVHDQVIYVNPLEGVKRVKAPGMSQRGSPWTSSRPRASTPSGRRSMRRACCGCGPPCSRP
ncbi:phage integrase SAM-like domain-containing protein [Deinococcus apachensis]|uniref:phage integrase SAM-like domain-containing protein n=1 Tax=Deinococcus apachensis TaxID=309886 RepID=UPI00039DAD7C|nr:phage integrase SAM-like domain-containing protein [Deinococcus apachensis]